jgi:sugar phosphate permease
MDRAYYYMLGTFLLGGCLGLFLKPKVVGIFVGVVLGLLVAAVAIGALTRSELMIRAALYLMGAPIYGALLFAGAAAADGFVASRKSKAKGGGNGRAGG